jgi:hypothetical protein
MAVHATILAPELENDMIMRIALAGVLLALAPRALHAQDVQDSVRRRNECRLARQVLETGHPATHYQWALDRAWHCPEAAAGIRSRMERTAASRDTAALNALTQPTLTLRDGGIFRTALAIAGDKGASTEARIFAGRTLIYTMRPSGGIAYEAFVNPDRSCSGDISPHQSFVSGAPVPADYVDRIHTLGRRLQADGSEPAVIRRLGVCLMLARELILH